jgi:uncharacterized protein
MSTVLTAIGLVFVIEGMFYALAPGALKRMMAMLQNMPDDSLRLSGLIAASLGVAFVWGVRFATGT